MTKPISKIVQLYISIMIKKNSHIDIFIKNTKSLPGYWFLPYCYHTN